MPVPFWPVAMRQTPQRGSWTGGPQDTRAKFEPEYGPPLMRRRTTAETEIWQGLFPNLNASMRSAFRSFCADDLAGGALAFSWRDPVTDEVALWRIMGSGDRAYDMVHNGAGLSDLSLQMMRLPGTPWWAAMVLPGRSQAPDIALGFAPQGFGAPPVRQSFQDMISLTRASIGTFVDANGILQTAAANAPRIDPNGLVIEPGRTNLMLRSEEFDNATWIKSELTVTPNTNNAPDGTATGDRLIPTVVSAQHILSQSVAGIVSGQTYEASIFVRRFGYNWARVSLGVSFPTNYVLVDLLTGAVGLNLGASNIRVETFSANWFRVSFTVTANASGNGILSVRPYDANSLADFAGDGTSAILSWGAQLATGAVPTSYIPTAGATAQRQADVVTLVSAITNMDVRIVDRAGLVTDLLNTTIAAGTWPAAAAAGARSIAAFPAGTL